MITGWIVATSLAAWWSVRWAHRWVRSALPPDECQDFQRFGNQGTWNIQQCGGLPGPVGDFVRRVSAQPSDAARVDLVCERLAEVDEQTTQIPDRLAMLARCMLALGGTVSVICTAGAIGQHLGAMALAGGLPLLIAAGAAYRCWWLGRVVRGGIKQRRRDWDGLSQLLMRQPRASLPTSARNDQPGGPETPVETSSGRLNYTVGRWRLSARIFGTTGKCSSNFRLGARIRAMLGFVLPEAAAFIEDRIQ